MEHILELMDILAVAKNRSPRTISRLVAGSGDVYDRLGRGGDLTTRRAGRICKNISDMWLPDLAWPRHIPRPVPSCHVKNTGEN